MEGTSVGPELWRLHGDEVDKVNSGSWLVLNGGVNFAGAS